MSRISEVFAERKSKGRGGFIPFITAGDPDLSATEELLRELVEAAPTLSRLAFPSAIQSRMVLSFNERRSAHLAAGQISKASSSASRRETSNGCPNRVV